MHTVGPVWRGGGHGEPELLASCYARSLELATEVEAASIAFPAISTGIYGYPLRDAALVAVRTVQAVLPDRDVILVAYSAADADIIREVVGPS